MKLSISAAGWLLAVAIGAIGCASGSSRECLGDGDCPAGRYCLQGTCTFDCTFHPDCPEGYRCSERGRCERGCLPTNQGVEICDGLDNDCDELTDEDYLDLGLSCELGCGPGKYVCTGDGGGTTCDAPMPAGDDQSCDGEDDDCDGLTDEDAPDLPCELQAGVCAGALRACLGSAGYAACDYGPDFVAGLDARCDQLDEDCDGLTDEDALLLLPESAEQAADGVDNNCNGLIDEPGGVMVPIPGHPRTWIDAYETSIFATADCSGVRYGEAGDDYPAQWPTTDPASIALFACSLPGLTPSGHLSWYRARRACQAQGKRLCHGDEWGAGCSGSAGNKFPYGFILAAGVCNDHLSGLGAVAPAGAHESCTAGDGTYDMSGNLNEWLVDWSPPSECAGCAVTAGGSYLCEICPCGFNCRDCSLADDEQRVDNLYDCGAGGERSYEQRPLDQVRPYFGTRCCFAPDER